VEEEEEERSLESDAEALAGEEGTRGEEGVADGKDSRDSNETLSQKLRDLRVVCQLPESIRLDFEDGVVSERFITSRSLLAEERGAKAFLLEFGLALVLRPLGAAVDGMESGGAEPKSASQR